MHFYEVRNYYYKNRRNIREDRELTLFATVESLKPNMFTLILSTEPGVIPEYCHNGPKTSKKSYYKIFGYNGYESPTLPFYEVNELWKNIK